MSVRVLVLLAEGFEEIEAITAIDVLRRAGAEVVAAGLVEGPIRASRGVQVVPDTTLARVSGEHFDAIVLPGGGPGAKNLAADERVTALLRSSRDKGVLIGAICAAPAVVLKPAGLLEGKRATCHPNLKSDLPGWSSERVVTDGRLLTSQAPGTALEFALALVGELFGAEKRAEVAGPMVAR